MGVRKLNPSGKRLRTEHSGLAAVAAAAADRASSRSKLLLECTRAVLRTRDERALGRTLCGLLAQSGLYAKASISFVDDTRNSKAGPRLRESSRGGITLPLQARGQTIAILRLKTSDDRPLDDGEIALLETLADDAAYAIDHLRTDARQTPDARPERGLRETVEHDGVAITRKHEEQVARSERALLRTIIDAVPHYIYVKDRAGRFTLANKAWLDARGLAMEEVQGKTVYELFPAALAQQLEEQDSPIFTSGVAI
ncbi:MAG TPA: PAS domain-containing protein, partial [Burkholderiales bacterium]|nr:PAS domain-containing protein [Burkholderiales bacterium]